MDIHKPDKLHAKSLTKANTITCGYSLNGRAKFVQKIFENEILNGKSTDREILR